MHEAKGLHAGHIGLGTRSNDANAKFGRTLPPRQAPAAVTSRGSIGPFEAEGAGTMGRGAADRGNCWRRPRDASPATGAGATRDGHDAPAGAMDASDKDLEPP